MKVLLFEQFSGGHYANYMNCLVPEVARLSDKLVIAVNARMRNSRSVLDSWVMHPNVEFADTLPNVSPGLRAGDRYAATKNLLACLKAVRPDFTMLPSADAQSTGLAALRALGFNATKHFGPIEGTFHCGYGHSAVNSKERLNDLVYAQTYRRVPFASINFVNFAYHEYAPGADPLRRGSGVADAAHRQACSAAAACWT